MNFREAESYLLSLGNEVETMKLGLDNIRKLLTALGDPQNKYLKVQVAGTNGKGSVSAFLDSICGEATISTGVFTSPHLVSITERVRINGVDIAEEDFARCATSVRDTAERMVTYAELEYTPTFFEQVTAIALMAFAEAKVDLAILETGLGGRLDATTAANAEIAAITRIDVDHQEYLGDTIDEIAMEKAAIIRSESSIVIGDQCPEAERVLLERCAQLGVRPMLARGMYVVIKGGNTSGSECVQREYYPTWAHSLPVVFPPFGEITLGLPGRHQIENAKVAVLLTEILQAHFPIATEHRIAGLKTARHPGRLESHGRFLFDGAHNPGGAAALAEFLDELVGKPITMIFGAVRGKDVAQMAAILFQRAENVILTKLENSRALTAQEIADSLPESIDVTKLHLIPNVAEALAKAESIVSENGLILVTGSLYLVGEVKHLLKSQI